MGHGVGGGPAAVTTPRYALGSQTYQPNPLTPTPHAYTGRSSIHPYVPPPLLDNARVGVTRT